MAYAKPCPNPRCKSAELEVQATEAPRGAIGDHRVRCLKCGLTGPRGNFPGQAKAAWNDMLRDPEMGPKTAEMSRKIVGVLKRVIADKTGYASIYMVCGDGTGASVEFLTCVADAWDVVHEGGEAGSVGPKERLLVERENSNKKD